MQGSLSGEGTRSSSSVSADDLLAEIAEGTSGTVAGLLARCRAADAWPVSPAACLYASVKLQRVEVTAQLLAAGAPPHFLVSDLRPADCSALAAAGICTAGVEHLSPLAIAVRQQSATVARLLLLRGAPAAASVAGVPLLVHLADVAGNGNGSGSSSGDGGGRGCNPSPSAAHLPAVSQAPSAAQLCLDGADMPPSASLLPLAVQPHASSASINSSVQGGGSAGGSASGCVGLLPAGQAGELEARLQLLWLLLRHRADPLQAVEGAGMPRHSFLSYCRDPALLRLAVNFVRHQIERGQRAVSDEQAAQLVAAAGRAFLGGY